MFARLSPELEARFREEDAAANVRRLRVLLPVMTVVHIVHVLLFGLADDTGIEVRWHGLLVYAHAVMLPITLGAGLLLYLDPRRATWIAPLVGFAYLQHGAWVAGIDQIVSTNISVYIAYCFGVAIISAWTPRNAVIAYACGAASLVASLTIFQEQYDARMTNMPTTGTLTVVCVAFSMYLYATRRRELAQRAMIDRQRDELTVLNASLAERVEAQVSVIAKRAAEVERLNAELAVQVRARSEGLSLALARLADGRDLDREVPVGTVLGNRFEITGRLGHGGMGTVHAGIDRSSGGRVAVKVIQAASVNQLDAMRRFIREVGVAAAVQHPAVVRMIHVDVSDDGLLYQVQELVEGTTLLSIAPPIAPEQAARIIAVLCEALAAVHAAGIVHRDIKPDNVMLTTGAPGLKLLDFGIAKLHDIVSITMDTTARIVIGTPGYMAPEQQSIDGTLTERTDLYAVGVLLFQLLTAQPPLGVEPTAPFEDLLERCTRATASDRPTASDVASELHAYADRHGVPALEQLVPALLTHQAAGVHTAARRRKSS